MALQGSVSSSSLHQDETKQKALNLKLKLFRLGLFSHQRITKLYCLWSISMYYVFCFGLYIIVSVWADWRSESNDVFHLIGLCVSLVATVAGFIIMFENNFIAVTQCCQYPEICGGW